MFAKVRTITEWVKSFQPSLFMIDKAWGATVTSLAILLNVFLSTSLFNGRQQGDTVI